MDVTRIAVAQTPVQVAVAKQVLDQARVEGEGVVRLLESSGTGSGADSAPQQGRYLDAKA